VKISEVLVLYTVSEHCFIHKLFGKQKNKECEFRLTLKLKNTEELKNVVEKITKVEGVKSINRTFD